MNLSEQDVLHLAALARLSLTREEQTMFPKQLDGILDFVKTVSEAEMTSEITRDMTNVNTMREDIVTNEPDTSEREEIMKNMPEREGEFLSVPKIL